MGEHWGIALRLDRIFFTGWMPFLSLNQQCQSTEVDQLTYEEDYIRIFRLQTVAVNIWTVNIIVR